MQRKDLIYSPMDLHDYSNLLNQLVIHLDASDALRQDWENAYEVEEKMPEELRRFYAFKESKEGINWLADQLTTFTNLMILINSVKNEELICLLLDDINANVNANHPFYLMLTTLSPADIARINANTNGALIICLTGISSTFFEVFYANFSGLKNGITSMECREEMEDIYNEHQKNQKYFDELDDGAEENVTKSIPQKNMEERKIDPLTETTQKRTFSVANLNLTHNTPPIKKLKIEESNTVAVNSNQLFFIKNLDWYHIDMQYIIGEVFFEIFFKIIKNQTNFQYSEQVVNDLDKFISLLSLVHHVNRNARELNWLHLEMAKMILCPLSNTEYKPSLNFAAAIQAVYADESYFLFFRNINSKNIILNINYSAIAEIFSKEISMQTKDPKVKIYTSKSFLQKMDVKINGLPAREFCDDEINKNPINFLQNAYVEIENLNEELLIKGFKI